MQRIETIYMKDLDNILVIDTVGETAMVALNGQVVAWEAKRNHSDQLLENVDRILKSQKVLPQSLKGVVVAVGPSTSFTGVRVGITVANGMGYGLNIPVAGVSEFEIINTSYPEIDWSFVDAKRREIFFQHGKEAGLMSLDEVGKKIRKGDSVYMSADILKDDFVQLEKAGTIFIGSQKPEDRAIGLLRAAKLPRSYRQVLPLYLREANITKPKNRKSGR